MGSVAACGRERSLPPLLLVAVVAGALAGCTGAPLSDDPVGTASPTASAVAEGPAASEPAADDLDRFDAVNRAVIAADASAGGTAFVAALAEAGFDRRAIEVTSDTTTLGEPADSIQFAVRVDDRCLVGQYGGASGGYRSMGAAVLGTGGCLVGATGAAER